jgi:hypothetical protein
MSISKARAILDSTTHSDFRLKYKSGSRTVEEEIADLKEFVLNTREALRAALDERG